MITYKAHTIKENIDGNNIQKSPPHYNSNCCENNSINLLSIGNSNENLHSINIAYNLGFNVIAVGKDINEDFPTFVKQYKIDIKDKEAVLQIAKKYKIKAVLPAPIGRYITTVGYINDKLKLIGANYYATKICADKRLLSKRLFDSENSFNLPIQISSKEKNLEELIKSKLSYPIIIKPRFGSGSKYVKVLYSFDEVLEFIDKYSDDKAYGELLIEEYLYLDKKNSEKLDEFGVDAVVKSSKIEFMQIRKKVLTPPPYRQELAYIAPANIDNQTFNIVKNYLERVVEKLEIKNSMLNLDLFISKNNNIYLIELSPRPAGLKILGDFFMLSYGGENIIEHFIKYQLGNSVDFSKIKSSSYSLMQYIDIENVEIKNDIKMQELKDRYDIAIDNINIKKGDKFSKIKNGIDISNRGYYIISNTNFDNLLKINKEILNTIKKEMINEQ